VLAKVNPGGEHASSRDNSRRDQQHETQSRERGARDVRVLPSIAQRGPVGGLLMARCGPHDGTELRREPENLTRVEAAKQELEEIMGFGRGILLWLLGIPLPIIILLALFWR
jgi:hypothetical protein